MSQSPPWGRAMPRSSVATVAPWSSVHDAAALYAGLVDGIGDIRSVMRQRFGEKVRLQVIPPAKPSLLARLFNRPAFVPESLLDPAEALAVLEERAAWARLGL